MPKDIEIQTGRGKVRETFYTKDELDSFSFADGDRFMERLFEGAGAYLKGQLDTLDSELTTLDSRLQTQEGKMSDLETSLTNLGESLTTLDTYLNGIDTHITDLDNLLGDPPDSATFFSSIVTNQAWIDQLVVSQAWLDNLFVNNAYADRITANEIKAGTITASEINVGNLVASTAFYNEFTATNGFIDTLVANDVYADKVATNQAFVDNLFANTITVTDVIQSSNYASGTAGFSINGVSGSAEFNDIIVRGDIYTGNGSIGTIDVTSDGLTNTGGDFLINSDGFTVYSTAAYDPKRAYNIVDTGSIVFSIFGDSNDVVIESESGAELLMRSDFGITISTRFSEISHAVEDIGINASGDVNLFSDNGNVNLLADFIDFNADYINLPVSTAGSSTNSVGNMWVEDSTGDILYQNGSNLFVIDMTQV